MERGAKITFQKGMSTGTIFVYVCVYLSGSWTPLKRAHFEEKEGI